MELPVRILTTGWRDWPEADKDIVWQKLDEFVVACQLPAEFVLVHGQCEYGGADLWSEQWAIAHGFKVEPHPARKVNGRILGPERNAKMVNLGAAVCLGFPGPGSRGTINCMNLARRAGIEVRSTPWRPRCLDQQLSLINP
jgi:hypothetical protein